MMYNVISGTGKVSLHHYRKKERKKGIGGTMENMVLILLAVGWACTCLYMLIQLHGFDEEYDED